MDDLSSLAAISWFLEFVDQRPIEAGVLAVISFILACIFGAIRQAFQWRLTNLYPVRSNDKFGKSEEFYTEIPPRMAGFSNMEYIDRKNYGPELRLKRICFVLWIIVCVMSIYAAAVAATSIKSNMSPLFVFVFVWFLRACASTYVASKFPPQER